MWYKKKKKFFFYERFLEWKTRIRYSYVREYFFIFYFFLILVTKYKKPSLSNNSVENLNYLVLLVGRILRAFVIFIPFFFLF